jgi:2-polyprenyl-3-methyl-5-hydroxy-6-metoxy-1,4-benzoquinol methylase
MWDDRYSQEGFSYGTEPNDYLKSVAASTLNMPTGARVLMLADGEGRNGVFMAERGFDVTCVDLSAVGLQKVQALASSRGVTVETIVTDLGTYEFGVDRWDCVVGISSQLPPAIRERVLSLIPPSVKPNGYVVFEGYTPDQLRRPPIRRHDVQLRDLLQSVWKCPGRAAEPRAGTRRL